MILKSYKSLPTVLLILLAFNFIHSEIIDQFDGSGECHQTHDYCKLVEAASVKTLSPDKVVTNDFLLIDFICPHCLKFVNSKELYEKYQNNSFQHLELPPAYLVNRTFLI